MTRLTAEGGIEMSNDEFERHSSIEIRSSRCDAVAAVARRQAGEGRFRMLTSLCRNLDRGPGNRHIVHTGRNHDIHCRDIRNSDPVHNSCRIDDIDGNRGDPNPHRDDKRDALASSRDDRRGVLHAWGETCEIPGDLLSYHGETRDAVLFDPGETPDDRHHGPGH